MPHLLSHRPPLIIHHHYHPQQPIIDSFQRFRCPITTRTFAPLIRLPKSVGVLSPSRRIATTRCMANQRRVKMVAKQIRRELSDMLLTDKVLQFAVLPEAALGADRYLSSLTTISDVEVSTDLQVVKVYISVFGDERGRDVAISGLKSKAKYVRSELGRRMKLRLTPEIRFIEDESIERGSREIFFTALKSYTTMQFTVPRLAIRFLESLYLQPVNSERDDSMIWIPSPKGFEVNSFYRSISGFEGSTFPWKSVWRSKAPPRVAFFGWASVHGKILTLDNLKLRQRILVNWCCMCKRSEESVDHLLIHCPVARDCWSLLLGLFRTQWVMPSSTRGLMEAWSGGLVDTNVRKFWKATPLCVWWCLWRERNRRTFENEETPNGMLKFSILCTLSYWVQGRTCSSMGEMIDFLSSFAL